MEKKKAIEKIKKIHQYHNQVKDLYRPVPSEIKKVELEMVNKKRETIVREKQPYKDYLQHVRDENSKIKVKKKQHDEVPLRKLQPTASLPILPKVN